MSKKTIFEGFSQEKQKEYERQAIEQWGEDNVNPSIKRWNSYSGEEKEAIKKEGGAIYQDLVAVIDQGPHSAAAQAILLRWHQHLRYFYEPSLERLRGLGNGYNEHPDFNATFAALHPGLPAFLQQAINHYVDQLEEG